MKNINWINNFVEEQKIKSSNNYLLKKLELTNILVTQHNYIGQLKKDLSHQKVRITRQTNKQNLENSETTSAISDIYTRLFKLEKRCKK